MKSSSDNTQSSYVSNRVLKINVGFLLNDGPGHNRDLTFDVPTVRVAEDLTIDYLRGPMRLSRTTEGILVQGKMTAGMSDECYRCLTDIQRDVYIEIEELVTYPHPIGAEFSVGDDGILDLSPLVRAEMLIETERRALCRPDCKGLCPDCGANLNDSVCTCDMENIDPRMAKLKDLLKSSK